MRNGKAIAWAGLLILLVLSAAEAGKGTKSGTAAKQPAGTKQTKEAVPTATPTPTPEPAPPQVVVMKLDGELRELPPDIDLGLPDLLPNVFWDQLRLVRMATADKSVTAIVVLVKQPELNLGQAQELLAELRKFAQTGKKVYYHSDSIDHTTYLPALAANDVTMTPGAMLLLAGVGAEVLYYKGLLDKLGIEADMVHVGQFKLAGEPFTQAEASAEMKQQLDELVDDLYGQMVREVAAGRRLDPEAAKAAIDDGPFTTEEAVKRKLIDRAEHRRDFLTRVTKETQGILVYDYGRTKSPQLKGGLSGLLQFLTAMGSATAAEAKDKIALVAVKGFITEGESEVFFGEDGTAGSETLRQAFKDIRDDKRIKAIVVRVDSPGGSSTASEVIWNQIRETAKDKPVAVSMGSEAASGGYYVSCGGQRVFASPGTLTGSIGVVAGKPVLAGLFTKIGVSAYTVTRGRNAGMFSLLGKFSDHERETLRAQLDDVYRLFTDRVREGRTDKIADLPALATGKVFTGERALGLGLIDQVGTLADAIEWAAKQAKLESYQVVMLPEPKTLPELLLEAMGYNLDPDAQIGTSMRNWPGGLAAAANLESAARLLPFPAAQRAAMIRLKSILRVLGRADGLALSPCHVEAR